MGFLIRQLTQTPTAGQICIGQIAIVTLISLDVVEVTGLDLRSRAVILIDTQLADAALEIRSLTGSIVGTETHGLRGGHTLGIFQHVCAGVLRSGQIRDGVEQFTVHVGINAIVLLIAHNTQQDPCAGISLQTCDRLDQFVALGFLPPVEVAVTVPVNTPVHFRLAVRSADGTEAGTQQRASRLAFGDLEPDLHRLGNRHRLGELGIVLSGSREAQALILHQRINSIPQLLQSRDHVSLRIGSIRHNSFRCSDLRFQRVPGGIGIVGLLHYLGSGDLVLQHRGIACRGEANRRNGHFAVGCRTGSQVFEGIGVELLRRQIAQTPAANQTCIGQIAIVAQRLALEVIEVAGLDLRGRAVILIDAQFADAPLKCLRGRAPVSAQAHGLRGGQPGSIFQHIFTCVIGRSGQIRDRIKQFAVDVGIDTLILLIAHNTQQDPLTGIGFQVSNRLDQFISGTFLPPVEVSVAVPVNTPVHFCLGIPSVDGTVTGTQQSAARIAFGDLEPDLHRLRDHHGLGELGIVLGRSGEGQALTFHQRGLGGDQCRFGNIHLFLGGCIVSDHCLGSGQRRRKGFPGLRRVVQLTVIAAIEHLAAQFRLVDGTGIHFHMGDREGELVALTEERITDGRIPVDIHGVAVLVEGQQAQKAHITAVIVQILAINQHVGDILAGTVFIHIGDDVRGTDMAAKAHYHIFILAQTVPDILTFGIVGKAVAFHAAVVTRHDQRVVPVHIAVGRDDHVLLRVSLHQLFRPVQHIPGRSPAQREHHVLACTCVDKPVGIVQLALFIGAAEVRSVAEVFVRIGIVEAITGVMVAAHGHPRHTRFVDHVHTGLADRPLGGIVVIHHVAHADHTLDIQRVHIVGDPVRDLIVVLGTVHDHDLRVGHDHHGIVAVGNFHVGEPIVEHIHVIAVGRLIGVVTVGIGGSHIPAADQSTDIAGGNGRNIGAKGSIVISHLVSRKNAAPHAQIGDSTLEILGIVVGIGGQLVLIAVVAAHLHISVGDLGIQRVIYDGLLQHTVHIALGLVGVGIVSNGQMDKLTRGHIHLVEDDGHLLAQRGVGIALLPVERRIAIIIDLDVHIFACGVKGSGGHARNIVTDDDSATHVRRGVFLRHRESCLEAQRDFVQTLFHTELIRSTGKTLAAGDRQSDLHCIGWGRRSDHPQQHDGTKQQGQQFFHHIRFSSLYRPPSVSFARN